LINVYNNGGQDEAERFIVEKLPGLMYNNGKGQVINRNDYLRWKFQNRKHVRIMFTIIIIIPIQLIACGRVQHII